jgi:hypothetical protein
MTYVCAFHKCGQKIRSTDDYVSNGRQQYHFTCYNRMLDEEREKSWMTRQSPRIKPKNGLAILKSWKD